LKLFTEHCTGGNPTWQKCPAGHVAHPDAFPQLYVPPKHASQLAAPPVEKFPGRHGRHAALPPPE
jgi:hypothetical protein